MGGRLYHEYSGQLKSHALPSHITAYHFSVRKLVALSLTILLNDDSRISYKVASIDLLAQGFATWQPFIRSDAVLKTMFTLAMDIQAGNALVYRRARRAITQIASVNPPLFVTTLPQEILDAKRPQDRIRLLAFISVFSRKVN